jgi:uncharacterized protein (DUF2236 family)
MAMLPGTLRRQYGIGWSPARERGVRRLATASRRLLALVPPVLRHAPQALAAERRVRKATAMMAARHARSAHPAA